MRLRKEQMHNYQNHVSDHIVTHTHCAAFLEMGLGKTVSTLDACNRLLFEEIAVDRVLIVATKRVAESVWQQEADKWEHLKHLRISRVIGSPKQRKEALKANAHIYVISRDNVQWLAAQYGGSKVPFEMMVIDESSGFKNHKSQRFKALRLMHFDRVVELTGTPSPNGLIDLWAPMYLLDKGERLGRTITEYRKNFFVPGQTNGHIVYNYKIKKGSEEKIYKAISDICISMKAKDYLEMVGRTNNNIIIPMPDELKKRYLQFEKDKVLEIFGTGQEITPANAAALNNKLLQFANGAVYDSEKKAHVIHDLKLEVLQEIMEDANGKPVLLAYTLQSDADRIEAYFAKYKPKRLKDDQDVKDWNAGKIPLLIMHPASGGHGLNLQDGGHLIVWFGQTWSSELEQQLNARLHRQGQINSVIIHKLILQGSMDEDVIKSQLNKQQGEQALMNAVRARVKKYLQNR